MKSWEKYENQIFDKLKREFPGVEILKNQKIKGIFSKRSRQIDILIKFQLIGKNLTGVIDCKNISKKIDVKAAESFIGFIEDIGANIGIMITNIGYTKSTINRITNYARDIRLDVVEFEHLEEYHFILDFCKYCNKGEIFWDEPETLINEHKTIIISRAECPYCAESYMKCNGCGEIIHIDEYMEDYECTCGNIFSFSNEYIGQGMTELKISLNFKAKQ